MLAHDDPARSRNAVGVSRVWKDGLHRRLLAWWVDSRHLGIIFFGPKPQNGHSMSSLIGRVVCVVAAVRPVTFKAPVATIKPGSHPRGSCHGQLAKVDEKQGSRRPGITWLVRCPKAVWRWGCKPKPWFTSGVGETWLRRNITRRKNNLEAATCASAHPCGYC